MKETKKFGVYLTINNTLSLNYKYKLFNPVYVNTVYYQNHMKHINTMCGENAEIFTVNISDTYSQLPLCLNILWSKVWLSQWFLATALWEIKLIQFIMHSYFCITRTKNRNIQNNKKFPSRLRYRTRLREIGAAIKECCRRASHSRTNGMHRKRFTSPFKYRLQEGVKTCEGAGVPTNYGKGSRGLSYFSKPQFELTISPWFYWLLLL